MLEALLANDVFAGVLGVGVIGTVAYHARAALALSWRCLVRRFTCEMTIHSGDSTFLYVNEWLARRSETACIRRTHLSESHEGDHWAFSVGTGCHVFMRSRPFMLVTREIQDGSNTIFTRQKLTIRTFGGGQRALRMIVDEAMQINKGDGRTQVFVWCDKGRYWQRASKERSRKFSSIVLRGDQAERILGDARHFFLAEEWYAEHGVPWRRGFLFHGPPGTGKSSTVHALAGELGKNIYVMSLNSMENDSSLMNCIACVPEDVILLIEDIDAALTSKRRSTSDEEEEIYSGISLAGLLNALDGVASGSGRLLVMTSNHPERLDRALTRPGRVDVREHFGLFGRDEVDRMVDRFHPGLRLLDLPQRMEVQPAELQGVLMSAPVDELEEKISRLGEAKE